MELAEMGQVQTFLLQHRIAETKPTGRRSLPGEKEVTEILVNLGMDELEELNELLSPQGLQVRYYTDMDYEAIPTGGQTWVLVRDPAQGPPRFMAEGALIEAMKIRETNTREEATTWFLHVWLQFLTLAYTNLHRAISDIGRFQDTFFYQSDLEESVREHIERLRQTGPEGGVDKRVWDTLTGERGHDIHRWVANFLEVMRRSRLIENIKGEEYRQTLLGAVEMAENYSRALAHILPAEDRLAQIRNLGGPEEEPDGANESSETQLEDAPEVDEASQGTANQDQHPPQSQAGDPFANSGSTPLFDGEE